MDRNRVTVRYAKALVETARESNCTKEVYTNLMILSQSFANYKSFLRKITSQSIQSKENLQLIETLFGKEFHPLTMRFIKLVFTKHRAEYLPDIVRNSINMIREIDGIVPASLTTAIELSKETIETIKGKFNAKTLKTFELTTSVDPDLIGGFIFRVENEQFDASIASKLQKIKTELLVK
jgi:F-type H+-transporting ATPase subunit delta